MSERLEEREARLASVLEVQIGNHRRAEAAWLKAKVALECAEDTVAGMDRCNLIMSVAVNK